MPAYTQDWGDATGSEPLLAAARRNLTPKPPGVALRGDVLVFRMQAGVAKHAGILSALAASGLLEREVTQEPSAEPAYFIHAVEDLGVSEVALTRWWRRRIAAAFAFPGVN
jgi:NlpC/P60 family putative phage cell wall peptidase